MDIFLPRAQLIDSKNSLESESGTRNPPYIRETDSDPDLESPRWMRMMSDPDSLSDGGYWGHIFSKPAVRYVGRANHHSFFTASTINGKTLSSREVSLHDPYREELEPYFSNNSTGSLTSSIRTYSRKKNVRRRNTIFLTLLLVGLLAIIAGVASATVWTLLRQEEDDSNQGGDKLKRGNFSIDQMIGETKATKAGGDYSVQIHTATKESNLHTSNTFSLSYTPYSSALVVPNLSSYEVKSGKESSFTLILPSSVAKSDSVITATGMTEHLLSDLSLADASSVLEQAEHDLLTQFRTGTIVKLEESKTKSVPSSTVLVQFSPLSSSSSFSSGVDLQSSQTSVQNINPTQATSVKQIKANTHSLRNGNSIVDIAISINEANREVSSSSRIFQESTKDKSYSDEDNITDTDSVSSSIALYYMNVSSIVASSMPNTYTSLTNSASSMVTVRLFDTSFSLGDGRSTSMSIGVIPVHSSVETASMSASPYIQTSIAADEPSTSSSAVHSVTSKNSKITGGGILASSSNSLQSRSISASQIVQGSDTHTGISSLEQKSSTGVLYSSSPYMSESYSITAVESNYHGLTSLESISPTSSSTRATYVYSTRDETVTEDQASPISTSGFMLTTSYWSESSFVGVNDTQPPFFSKTQASNTDITGISSEAPQEYQAISPSVNFLSSTGEQIETKSSSYSVTQEKVLESSYMIPESSSSDAVMLASEEAVTDAFQDMSLDTHSLESSVLLGLTTSQKAPDSTSTDISSASYTIISLDTTISSIVDSETRPSTKKTASTSTRINTSTLDTESSRTLIFSSSTSSEFSSRRVETSIASSLSAGSQSRNNAFLTHSMLSGLSVHDSSEMHMFTTRTLDGSSYSMASAEEVASRVTDKLNVLSSEDIQATSVDHITTVASNIQVSAPVHKDDTSTSVSPSPSLSLSGVSTEKHWTGNTGTVDITTMSSSYDLDKDVKHSSVQSTIMSLSKEQSATTTDIQPSSVHQMFQSSTKEQSVDDKIPTETFDSSSTLIPSFEVVTTMLSSPESSSTVVLTSEVVTSSPAPTSSSFVVEPSSITAITSNALSSQDGPTPVLHTSLAPDRSLTSDFVDDSSTSSILVSASLDILRTSVSSTPTPSSSTATIQMTIGSAYLHRETFIACHINNDNWKLFGFFRLFHNQFIAIAGFSPDGTDNVFLGDSVIASKNRDATGTMFTLSFKNVSCSDDNTYMCAANFENSDEPINDIKELKVTLPSQAPAVQYPEVFVDGESELTCEADVMTREGDLYWAIKRPGATIFSRHDFSEDVRAESIHGCTKRVTHTLRKSWEPSLNGTEIRCQSNKPHGVSDAKLYVNVCQERLPGSLVSHPEDCNKYVVCIPGLVVIQSCPGVLCFQEDIRECVQPPDTQVYTNDDPFSCDGKPNGSYLPNKNSCTKYTWCVNGQGIDQTCAAGTFYTEYSGPCTFDRVSAYCEESLL